MADTRTIITISRQYGSGGRYIGRKLAEALDIPFYDKEIILRSAEESGISREIFEQLEEKPTNSLLYSLSLNAGLLRGGTVSPELPLSDQVFLIQSEIIRKMANQGPCVIVGRCSEYVLRDRTDCINVFLYSTMEDRIARATTYYGLPLEKAKEKLAKMDKKRASYYNFYTNLKWGQAENYDLCVNTASLGVEGTVELLQKFIETESRHPKKA
ncbi:MAG TPA: cytidylate kinase-like family protein [Candidatus Merdivicinus excrementipullorum]|uniref:Cytidylate kinase-like family protein n=1 Tax=Candidatus Merdivicinus excrementipullorum TaxID=2840867 RepID=A0A9D1FPQ5_9FIRM|nr:cytidylate kinase-like family protein [Candidatus Merdivicinus excrementipullorum]